MKRNGIDISATQSLLRNAQHFGPALEGNLRRPVLRAIHDEDLTGHTGLAQGPSRHQSTNSPIVTSSFIAGTTIDSSTGARRHARWKEVLRGEWIGHQRGEGRSMWGLLRRFQSLRASP
ncbi:MAG: hypothetical protein WDN28_25600 [Chthoniobacter sp.]